MELTWRSKRPSARAKDTLEKVPTGADSGLGQGSPKTRRMPPLRIKSEVRKMTHLILYTLALTVSLISEAGAQQIVYPANGQSQQQQKTDEAACYSWAVEKSGLDPA